MWLNDTILLMGYFKMWIQRYGGHGHSYFKIMSASVHLFKDIILWSLILLIFVYMHIILVSYFKFKNIVFNLNSYFKFKNVVSNLNMIHICLCVWAKYLLGLTKLLKQILCLLSVICATIFSFIYFFFSPTYQFLNFFYHHSQMI